MRKLWWVLLVFLLLGAVALIFSPGIRKVSLYQVGLMAARRGDWSTAFASFHALHPLDPGYRDVMSLFYYCIHSNDETAWRKYIV